MNEQVLSLWHGAVQIPPPNPSSQDILKAVAWQHQLSVAELLSPIRQKRYVRARWEAMHLLKVTPKPSGSMRSLPEIGRLMGGMDHTSVLHGLRRREEENRLKAIAKCEVEAA